MEYCTIGGNDKTHRDLHRHIDQCYMMSHFDCVVRKDIYEFESKELQYEYFSGLKTFTEMHATSTDDLHSPPMLLIQPSDDPLHEVTISHINIFINFNL